MRTILSSNLVAAFFVLTGWLVSTNAFAPLSLTTAGASSTTTRHQSTTFVAVVKPLSTTTFLHAEASEEAAEAEEAVAEEDAGEGEAEEEEEEQEDPEVKALKDEIEELEKNLKDKKSQISYLKDSTETYSKAGYARKVAEMENMRRTRSSMASSNRETSTATVLRNFLPVKDKLDMLRQEYGEDDFGKQYGALAGNFNTALADNLGVTDFTAPAGEPIDRNRVLVVEEEHSTEFPKDTVIRPLKLGLELKGNVIRLAECVGSLGDESEAEESTSETAEEPEE